MNNLELPSNMSNYDENTQKLIIEYLTQLQINAVSVAKNPELWLPWNFKAQLSSSNVA